MTQSSFFVKIQFENDDEWCNFNDMLYDYKVKSIPYVFGKDLFLGHIQMNESLLTEVRLRFSGIHIIDEDDPFSLNE